MHPRGFAFADREGGESIFVPPPLAGPFMSGDEVDVRVASDDPTTAVQVVLLRRTRREIFGVVEDDGALRADPHICGQRLVVEGARPGQAVRGRLADERVVALETFDDPAGIDALRARALVRYEVAGSVPEELEASEHGERRGRRDGRQRRDLREQVTFTIDADSSQDLDDAISVLAAGRDGALRVLIHIADVVEHVPEGGAVDRFAREVGTSVYLPGWNRPMLPRHLSERELSLLPGVDRDALTVELRITADGEVSAVDLAETRIRSDGRLSYDTAALVLAGREPKDADETMVETLRWLRTAAARLSLQRARRGGVESRRVEPELAVELHRDAAARAVPAEANGEAHLLIERLMVAANEAVAGWMETRGLPTLYRRHDAPGQDANEELELFANQLGIHPGFGSAPLTPLALGAFDAQLALFDSERAAAMWDVLIKHLGRARYTPEPGGHFGLGSAGYVHFTSPIRRYADLCVHRVIKAYLAGQREANAYPTHDELGELGSHLNRAARAAGRAEADCRKALWLTVLNDEVSAHPRKRMGGRVSGIAPRGVFVTLDGSLTTGMVSFRDLGDGPWHVEGQRAIGKNGRHLELGMSLEVAAGKIDIEAGMLDLRIPGVRRGRSERGDRSGGRGGRERGAGGDGDGGERAPVGGNGRRRRRRSANRTSAEAA